MVQLGDVAAGLGSGIQVGIQANQRSRALDLQDRSVGVQEDQIAEARKKRLSEINQQILGQAGELFAMAPDDDAKKRIYEQYVGLLDKSAIPQLDALLSGTPSKHAAAMSGAETTIETVRAFANEFGFPVEDVGAALGVVNPGTVPTSVQEYEYAKDQGYTGTFADYQSSKSPKTFYQIGPTGIDYGDPGAVLCGSAERTTRLFLMTEVRQLPFRSREAVNLPRRRQALTASTKP